MIIKTISYGFTKNLGNYQSERLDVCIELAHDDDFDLCVQALKELVHRELGVIQSVKQTPSSQRQ